MRIGWQHIERTRLGFIPIHGGASSTVACRFRFLNFFCKRFHFMKSPLMVLLICFAAAFNLIAQTNDDAAGDLGKSKHGTIFHLAPPTYRGVTAGYNQDAWFAARVAEYQALTFPKKTDRDALVGATLSFPIEFIKENGIWKIDEF
jgi:hypothetical protein